MNALLLYCRAGFEQECAQEIVDQVYALGIEGEAEALGGGGAVLFTPESAQAMARLRKHVRYDELAFARQLVFVFAHVELSGRDRAGPIAEAAARHGPYAAVWAEAADTETGKPVAAFARKFEPHLVKALEAREVKCDARRAPRLHVFFPDSGEAWLGVSDLDNGSPWPMGIPRLRFPREAPSRSTMKLAEAFHAFLGHDDQQRLLKQGLRAVDLGAAPGGWSWQLANRGIKVTAVDNGAMDRKLLADYPVTHVRDDGFRYRPAKPVDWMVCDMVESPSRIAQLVGKWLAQGWCRQCIFNLKLPMKRRYEELQRCRAILDAALAQTDAPFRLHFKQLYHDREEVTGYLCREG